MRPDCYAGPVGAARALTTLIQLLATTLVDPWRAGMRLAVRL
jgi:hypothetical protein